MEAPVTQPRMQTWQTPDQPWDVFVSSTSDYSPSRVTDLHADVARPAMGRTELLTWQATDGFEIEGLLTYPVGYRAFLAPAGTDMLSRVPSSRHLPLLELRLS